MRLELVVLVHNNRKSFHVYKQCKQMKSKHDTNCIFDLFDHSDNFTEATSRNVEICLPFGEFSVSMHSNYTPSSNSDDCGSWDSESNPRNPFAGLFTVGSCRPCSHGGSKEEVIPCSSRSQECTEVSSMGSFDSRLCEMWDATSPPHLL